MNENEKRRIIERYNRRLDEHGASFEALSSGTEERRTIRFETLIEIGMGSGDSVLDLGCAFGDFSAFLENKGLNVDYTGYDINPNLISRAREKYPERRFEVKDILRDEFPKFDYIVSTSCFNIPLSESSNYVYVNELLKTCYDHATKGVAIDFLSSYVDFQNPEGFHYDPEKVFGMAKQITKRVCLRHDYPLYEFCIYLKKDFQGWAT